MVIGIGTDIIEIERVNSAIKKSARFSGLVFTQAELSLAVSAQSSAGLFAAKEAVVKALGTGFSGFWPREVEIVKCNGVPGAVLHGKAAELAAAKGIDRVSVSISHCEKYAVACAVAEGGGFFNS